MGIALKDASKCVGDVKAFCKSALSASYEHELVSQENLFAISNLDNVLQSIEDGLRLLQRLSWETSVLEADLHAQAAASLGPGARIVAGKKLALIRELNRRYHPEDDSVWELFVTGARAAGTCFCPPHWAKKSSSGIEEDSVSCPVFEDIRGSIDHFRTRRAPNFMTLEDQNYVWKTSLEEVEEGKLSGPYELDQVVGLFPGEEIGPLVLRFAVTQKDKVRLCDDARETNASSRLRNIVPLPSTTSALALATAVSDFLESGSLNGSYLSYPKKRRLCVGASNLNLLSSSGISSKNLDSRVAGVVADVKGAYKIIPLRQGHKKYCLIAVYCPERERYLVFVSHTMIFGNLHSVTEWVRVSRFLISVQIKMLGLPSDIYIDDDHAFVPRYAGQAAKFAITQLWDTMGIEYKSNKVMCSTDPGADNILPLLGLEFVLSERPCLRVSDERITSLTSTIDEVVAANYLPPGAASKLLGRISFPLCSIIGRRFNPVLKPIVHRVFHDGTSCSLLNKSLLASLSACRELLPRLPVRSLKKHRGVSLLLSDASWSHGKGRIAGVLYQGSDIPMAGWYVCVLRDDIPEECHRAPINFLEAVAAIINQRVFRDSVQNTDVIAAIDNTAAEGLLLNMSSRRPILAGLAYTYWTDASCLNVSPWVTRVASELNIADWLTHRGLEEIISDHFSFSIIEELTLDSYGIREVLRCEEKIFDIIRQ